MKYRPEIDGLRAVAVIPVILFHAGFTAFSGGFIGVDIFFVISGYLITTIILADMERGTFSLANFYERRARRILPALLFVILCCLPFAWYLMIPAQIIDFAQSINAISAFVSNILFWREGGYMKAAAALKPLLHTWSLAVEEQYYVVFPIFMIMFWKYSKYPLSIVLTFIAVVSLISAEYGWRHNYDANFYLPIARAWELAIGGICAAYITEKGAIKGNQPISLLGLGLIFYAIFTFDKYTPAPSLYTLIPVSGAALIILFSTKGTIAFWLLSRPLFVGIGLISYSAYLWHQPLFAFVRLEGSFDHAGMPLLLSIIAVVLGFLSWRYIESPFRKKQQIKLKPFLLLVAAVLVFINSVAIYTISSRGFIERYPAHDRAIAGIDFDLEHEYVWRRVIKLNLTLKNFDDSNRTKLLVIGDSFSGDAVNALYESGIADNINISTYKISARCGNLMLEENFHGKIAIPYLPKCISRGWYDNDDLKKLMKEADVILLASLWTEWTVDLLPKSVENISKISNAKIIILGRKRFGNINMKALLSIMPNDRSKYTNAVSSGYYRINEHMKKIFDSSILIDTHSLFCPTDKRCRIFTDNNELISFDGGHLTPAGAKFMGDKLKTHPLIIDALRLNKYDM